MTELFDLPLHVLAVHAAVVLGPLMTLATIAAMAKASWRRRLGPALLAGLAVTIVATLIAMRSGEAFDEALDGLVDVGHHASLATTTRNLMFGWFVALAATVGADRYHERADRSDGHRPVPALAMAVLVTATIAFAVLSTIWTIRTGHEGARVTWSGVLD